MERRIIKVPEGITWEDFSKQFGKFFQISNERERTEKLKSEFERLTGRKADDGKVSRVKPTVRNIEPGSDGGKGHQLGKGSRKGGNEPEHGSTVARE